MSPRSTQLFEGALDVQSGAVAAGVEDARLGVSALLSERDSAVWGAVEVDAALDQAPDGGWSLGGEDFDGRFVAEPVAGADRVGGVALRVIGGGDGGGDPALCAVGIRLADGSLADQADGAVFTGEQGGVEAGETGADDQEVEVLGHGVGVQVGVRVVGAARRCRACAGGRRGPSGEFRRRRRSG